MPIEPEQRGRICSVSLHIIVSLVASLSPQEAISHLLSTDGALLGPLHTVGYIS